MHVPGARIFWLPKMHAYSMVHAPMGVIFACCCQNHLQLGVPLPCEPMVGVLSSQRPILGVSLSQRSTLGVLSPWKSMNMSGQLGKNLQQGGKADQGGASHPGLAQLSSILLHSRCPISEDNWTRNEILTKSLPTVDARGS